MAFTTTASGLQFEDTVVGTGTLTLKLGSATYNPDGSMATFAQGAGAAIDITIDDTNGKRVVDIKVGVDAGDYVIPARPLPGDKGHLVAVTCK